jgi:hypothetical protein
MYERGGEGCMCVCGGGGGGRNEGWKDRVLLRGVKFLNVERFRSLSVRPGAHRSLFREMNTHAAIWKTIFATQIFSPA